MTQKLLLFTTNLQELEAKSVITEIMTAGLSDEEIILVLKEITFNDSWKYESLRGEALEMFKN